jgi:hypothetical protein
VDDAFVDSTIGAIMKGGRTDPDDKIGDGKILAIPLEECIPIRTVERGSVAPGNDPQCLPRAASTQPTALPPRSLVGGLPCSRRE